MLEGRYEQFSSVITGIYRYIQKIERNEMIKYGYKGSYALYLMTMRRHPEGVTSAQLCELCDRDKAAVSRIITEMKSKGLICWGNESESRYRARLMLTEEGKKAAEYVSDRAKAAAAIVNEKLDEEQRKSMYTTLDMFSESLQSIVEEGIPGFD